MFFVFFWICLLVLVIIGIATLVCFWISVIRNKKSGKKSVLEISQDLDCKIEMGAFSDNVIARIVPDDGIWKIILNRDFDGNDVVLLRPNFDEKTVSEDVSQSPEEKEEVDEKMS